MLRARSARDVGLNPCMSAELSEGSCGKRLKFPLLLIWRVNTCTRPYHESMVQSRDQRLESSGTALA